MYRRLGSKHLFQKLDGSSSLPGCDLAKMIRKHPLLVLLSVLCKSLQRSLIFIALPFSACALFGKAGAKVRRFLIPSKCFERKVCESWQFFALFYKTRVKRGYFWEKGRKKGKAVVREQAVYICHYREISVPLSFNYFLLIIYIAQGRRKWPLWAKAPPPALLGEAQKPSPILRDGLGTGSGRKAAREQAYFSCKPGNRTTTLEQAQKWGKK